MKVMLSGVAVNRTTLREPKTSAPFVRSSETSYDWVSMTSRRSCASMRVRSVSYTHLTLPTIYSV